jgi:hypothetical protein
MRKENAIQVSGEIEGLPFVLDTTAGDEQRKKGEDPPPHHLALIAARLSLAEPPELLPSTNSRSSLWGQAARQQTSTQRS